MHTPLPESFSSCFCSALRGDAIKIEVFPVHAPCHAHTHTHTDSPQCSHHPRCGRLLSTSFPLPLPPCRGCAPGAATRADSHVAYHAAHKRARANKTDSICRLFNSRFCLNGNDFGSQTDALRALLLPEMDKQKRSFFFFLNPSQKVPLPPFPAPKWRRRENSFQSA